MYCPTWTLTVYKPYSARAYLYLVKRDSTISVDVDGLEDEFEVVLVLQHVIGKLAKVVEVVAIVVRASHENLS